MLVAEKRGVVVGVGRLGWEMSMLRGARSMVLIRAGGVGVSRSLRMRKVSGSIPDQSTENTFVSLPRVFAPTTSEHSSSQLLASIPASTCLRPLHTVFGTQRSSS